MKNKIKILGLASLLVLTPVQIRATELPERFRNYQEKATFTMTQPLQTPAGFFLFRKYDLTNPSDGEADVMEAYPAMPTPNGLMPLTEFPISYWFDLNGDKEVTLNEVLIDEAADGINGNEYGENQPEPHKDLKEI